MLARSTCFRTFRLFVPLTLVASGCGSSSENLAAEDAATDAGDASAEAASESSTSSNTVTVLDRARLGSKNGKGWPNFGHVFGDVDFGATPSAKVVLVVDLESSCYPFGKLAPRGQNWPADCDAFDRNFNVSIDDRPERDASTGSPEAGAGAEASSGDGASDAETAEDAAPVDAALAEASSADAESTPESGAADASDESLPASPPDAGPSEPPPFEIVHAITPFGGPEHLEVDITDLANGLRGKHRLRVDIDSWSDPAGLVTGSNAGWTVSAKVVTTPGMPPHDVLAVIPIYAGSVSAMDVPPVVSFTVPSGTTRGRFEYRTSGHGGGDPGIGCIGPAEEFCDRQHQIFFDGALVKTIETWRDDCASLCTPAHYGSAVDGFDYCLENPCGAPGSVRASRANWCPGSMTPPFVWEDVPALSTPGPHTWSFGVIPIVPLSGWKGPALPGGNWQGSAIYYAFGR
jgi:hypothetical protein